MYRIGCGAEDLPDENARSRWGPSFQRSAHRQRAKVLRHLDLDGPVLQLIASGMSELIPGGKQFASWSDWLRLCAADTWTAFSQQSGLSGQQLPRRPVIDFGLPPGMRRLGWGLLFAMPRRTLSGHRAAVRVTGQHSTIASQLVVNPRTHHAARWATPVGPKRGFFGCFRRSWLKRWERGTTWPLGPS